MSLWKKEPCCTLWCSCSQEHPQRTSWLVSSTIVRSLLLLVSKVPQLPITNIWCFVSLFVSKAFFFFFQICFWMGNGIFSFLMWWHSAVATLSLSPPNWITVMPTFKVDVWGALQADMNSEKSIVLRIFIIWHCPSLLSHSFLYVCLFCTRKQVHPPLYQAENRCF